MSKFDLGRLVATPGVLRAFERTGETPFTFLNRHVNCDWGDLTIYDLRANNSALMDGERLFSAYHLKDGTKIWIITEADRSSTAVLLPEEY